MRSLQLAVAALLVASTMLFAVGVIAEHSGPEATTVVTHADAGEGAHDEANENVRGIDTESTPLIVVAVLAGLGLAAVAATRFGRTPRVLLAIAAVVAAWAALDVREAVHQLNESRTDIALLAITVGVLHLAAAAIAGIGARKRSGTIPA